MIQHMEETREQRTSKENSYNGIIFSKKFIRESASREQEIREKIGLSLSSIAQFVLSLFHSLNTCNC